VSWKAARSPICRQPSRPKKKNFENRLKLDPEIRCYLPGVPRANYMPYPFQIFQSAKALFFAYQYDGAVRNIFLKDPGPRSRRFLDGAIRRQVGRRDPGDRRDRL